MPAARKAIFVIPAILFFTILLFAFSSAYAQPAARMPFGFTSEDENKLVREDDSFRYFQATGDTSHLVGINDELSSYRFLNRDQKVIAEGMFIMEKDKYILNGKCTSFYTSGRTKMEGCYRRGLPIGTWIEYYSGGKEKYVFNYGMVVDDFGGSSCLSGSYLEYYPDGKLKTSGFYGATVTKVMDTEKVTDPVDGQDVIKLIPRNSLKPVKTGHWEYYTESGDLEKKEEL